MSCAVLILADGSSCRDEALRALAPFGDDCLINHLAGLALAAGAAPVLRVLGARASSFAAWPAPSGVADVFNPFWARSDAHTVAAGLRAALAARPELDGTLLLPCDLSLTTAEPLAAMIRLVREAPDRIVQADLGDGGTRAPVAFGRAYFDELLTLHAGNYARQVVYRHLRQRQTVTFPDEGRHPGAWAGGSAPQNSGQSFSQR